MNRLLVAVSALSLLSACGDGQPFFEEVAEDTATDDGTTNDAEGLGDEDGVNASERPPGTEDATASSRVVRFEPTDGDTGGYLRDSVVYNPDDDTITVNNLAFDGENVYSRGTSVSSINGYAVYEAALEAPDTVSGVQIDQISDYRAIVGLSRNDATRDGETVPRTSFAIVRTGGYVGYGFGGFVYSREGEVVLPSSSSETDGVFAGQATFTGDYAGIRVFDSRGGLEFTEGDMWLTVDFDDFDSNNAVNGRVTNRRAYTSDRTPIALGTGDDDLQLPDLKIVIEAGSGSGVDSAGEVTGGIQSHIADANGNLSNYETGSYYAIIAGDTTDPADGGEVVGVMVVESTDPRYDSGVQETGGFILYR